MKKWIFILILMTSMCALSVYAQSSEIDSLKSAFTQMEDTAAIRAAIAIGEGSLSVNRDTSYRYTKWAIDESERLAYLYGLVEGHNQVSKFYLLNRNVDSSRYHVDRSYNYAINGTDDFLIFRALRFVAWHHYYFEDYPASLAYYLEMIDHSERSDIYDEKIIGRMNAATIYTRMYDFEDANELYSQLINITTARGDSMRLLQTYVNLAANYQDEEQQIEKLSLLNSAYLLADRLDSEMGKAKTANLLASIYLKTGQWELADQYANRIITSGTSDLQSLGLAYKYRAAVADSLGQINDAFGYANESLRINRENASGTYLTNSFEQLYLLHKKYNNPSQALYYYELYTGINDSLFNLEKNQRINELTEQYESEKAKNEIVTLKKDQLLLKERQQQQNVFWILSIIVALMIAGMIYLFQRNRLLQKDKHVIETKQKLLRAQINPHFIFNTLNAIQSQIYEKPGMAPVSQYLSKFAALMRRTLESSIEEYHDLEDEIDNITDYLTLQQLRFSNRFEFRLDIADDIEPTEILIPAMITQPFLENAVLHAFPNGHQGKGNIEIRFSKTLDMLMIVILDDGVGIDNSEHISNKKHISRALDITKERLSIIYKDRSIDLEINDRSIHGDSGTEIRIPFPLQT